jgi:hypothetical protein
MDRDGFRAMLRTRNVSDEGIEASIALVERFEEFRSGATLPAEAAWAFSRLLIEEGANTEANYLALARYGRFTRDDELFVAILELLDGAEAQGNLYRRVGEVWGEEVRDRAFAGMGLSPLGLPSTDKPRFLHPVLARLEQEVGQEACRQLLSASLRDLPDRYFLGERRRVRRSTDIDDYLRKKHRAFVRELRKCQREGQLFFAQEITDDVAAFVESDPEIESGRREGNVVYVTKIPYMAQQFLAETDPTLKRYYACHCPWAREAIKSGDVQFFPDFCYCSAGFHKKPWEVIFRHPLQAQVLESVLQGDSRCRFAIYLPEEAVPAQ